MSVSTEPVNPLRIPEDGLDNPVFDQLDEQGVHVVLIAERVWSEETVDQAIAILSAWLRDQALWEGNVEPGHQPAWMHETKVCSAGLWMTVVRARHPRPPLVELMRRFADAGLRFREELFGVIEWRDEDGGETSSRDPSAPPVATDLGSIDEFWNACFDHGGPLPDSEMQRETYEAPNEMRLTRLHIPGLRLAYVTPTPSFLEPSERAGEVMRAVTAAVQARFGSLMAVTMRDEPEQAAPVPGFFDRNGDPAEHAERIFRNGRAGYSLACHADGLRAEYPRQYGDDWAFRMREYELFTAIRDVVVALELEPVVMWRRFRGDHGYIQHLEIQLWERLDAPASAEARADIARRRTALIEAGELGVLPLEQAPPAAPALVAAAEVAGAEQLPAGTVVLRGPAGRHLALVPGDDGADRLQVIGPDGVRPVDAPASRYYRDPGRAAMAPDGRRAVLATQCAARAVDLEQATARDLIRGVCYQAVVAAADGLAVVRGAVGPCTIDNREADLVTMCNDRGWDLPDRPRDAEAPPALYVLDLDAEDTDTDDDDDDDDDDENQVLVQTVPCRAGQLAAVAGGRVVTVWTPYESWRTAILVVANKRLHLLDTLREALPDLHEHDGRLVSSNAVELVGVEAAAARFEPPVDDDEPDLSDIEP